MLVLGFVVCIFCFTVTLTVLITKYLIPKVLNWIADIATKSRMGSIHAEIDSKLERLKDLEKVESHRHEIEKTEIQKQRIIDDLKETWKTDKTVIEITKDTHYVVLDGLNLKEKLWVSEHCPKSTILNGRQYVLAGTCKRHVIMFGKYFAKQFGKSRVKCYIPKPKTEEKQVEIECIPIQADDGFLSQEREKVKESKRLLDEFLSRTAV